MKKILLSFILILSVHKLCLWTQPFGPILEKYSFSKEILDRNDRLLRVSLATDETYRVKADLGEISPLLINGTLLFEDRFFYYHLGVNPFSLVKAVWLTYVKKTRVVGASTITMQLARKHFDLATRSPVGKLKQILYATYLEFFYSKDEILEAYFNIAPYGFNIEGVGAASRIYFNQDVGRLTLVEALTLAVIPQSPYRRTRHITKEKQTNEDLKSMRSELFKSWVHRHPQWKSKKAQFDLDIGMRPPQSLPFLAPHLTTRLIQRQKESRLKSTIDMDVQQMIESITRAYLHKNKNIGFKNASVLLIDTKKMEALAYLGSAFFTNNEIQGQVDGLTSRRSPGSALKPFIFALGIEQGVIHPHTMMKDAPTPFGTYTPDNFDKMFAGPLSATRALVLSRNIPALDLESQLEPPGLYGLLSQVGVPLHPDPQHYGLSIVLGSAEISMIELLQLYASLNNSGNFQNIKFVQETKNLPQPKKIFSKEAAFLVRDMLSKNEQPGMELVNRLRARPQSIGWKTGTSVGYKDAWSIAVFDHYAVGVWVGNFSGEGNVEFVGRKAAGPLLFRIIDSLAEVKDIELKTWDPPLDLNLTSETFCSRSGEIPNKHCHHRIKGWFIPGVSPIDKCDVHRKILVDQLSGLQVCPGFPGAGEQVHEYWSSDLLKVFEQAGMGRKKPPGIHPSCKQFAHGDIAPKIISPKRGIEYSLRSKGSDSKEIPLIAVTDGQIRNLTWYMNNKKLGQSPVNQALIWKAVAGNHLLRVVDDQGRHSEVNFQVKRFD